MCAPLLGRKAVAGDLGWVGGVSPTGSLAWGWPARASREVRAASDLVIGLEPHLLVVELCNPSVPLVGRVGCKVVAGPLWLWALAVGSWVVTRASRCWVASVAKLWLVMAGGGRGILGGQRSCAARSLHCEDR